MLLPVLVVGGGLLGRQLAVPLSRLDPTVALAERVRAENLGLVEGTTDASDAFRNTGRPLEDLYAAALAQRHKLAWAGDGLRGVGRPGRRREADPPVDPPAASRLRAQPGQLRLLRTVFLVLPSGAGTAGALDSKDWHPTPRPMPEQPEGQY